MDGSVTVIGILAAFIIGLITGWKLKSDQDNKSNGGTKKPPTQFESTIKTGFSTNGTDSFSIRNVSDLNWYDSYVLILHDCFTMERAASFNIGRKRWEKIRDLLIANGLLKMYPELNRTVHPPTQLARNKIRELLVQSNKRIDWRAIHRKPIVPKVQLDPKEGWKPLPRPIGSQFPIVHR